MKKKYRLKRKVKITGVIFITLICAAYLFAGGFNTLKSAYTSMINYLAAGDTPTIAKNIKDNHDGTYQLSLSVKGDADKKTPKANIIVIVDRSGSMDTQSGTGAYVPSNQNWDNMYGLIDGEYVHLEHRTSGWGWNTQHSYWYNGEEYTGQRYYEDTTATRLQATKAAVDGLADSLLGYNGREGNPNDTVEMALVSFATTASTNVAKTNDKNTYINAVNGLTIPGGNAAGTNWEDALQEANGISFGDNDPTYVIFFSDGAPTFYNNSSGTGVSGSGYEQQPNMENSYNAATDDAATLANKVGVNNFYTIFAYGTNTGSNYMTNLTTAAGAPSGNNYSASSTAELNAAFAQILENIQVAGIAEAVIDDGTTGEVKISSTDEHGLLRVDESSYKFTISFPIKSGKVQLNGKEATVSGNKITWGDGKELVGEVQGNNFIYTWTEENDLYDFVPEATNTNGKVEWDLSECGVLVNEATYTVYFDVYPSQETYDMIAKIKNGKTTAERKALYDALDENVKKYLEPNTDYTSFTLKTNTVATLDYDDTRTPENEESITYKNPDPVATEATKIQVTKEWENDLDGQSSQPVSMDLKQNGTVIDHLTLNSDGNWTDSRFIATGLLKTVKDTNNNIIGLNVLDEGHDYTLTEPTDLDYYWELTAETVHPMKIDGELTTLIEVTGKDIPSGMGSNDYYADGSNKYYRINGKVYFAKYNGDTAQLTATNNRKSNLNVKKVVNGDALEGEKFKFTFNVNNIGDTDAWFSVWDTNKNEYVYNLDTNAKHGPDHPTADPTPGEESYYMENGSEFYVWLEDGWNLRFFNLGTGSTYSVEEVVNSPYDLKEVKAETIVTSTKELPATAVSIGNNQWRYGPEGDPDTIIFTKVEKDGKVYYSFSYTPKVEGKVTTGEVVAPNTSYNVQYTNEYPKTNFEIEKKWFDKTPTGTSVEMTLYKNGEPTEQKITLDGTKDDNGETAAWVATFKDLDLTENGEIIEYSAKETAINGYKAVYSGTATATVSASAPADESAIEAVVKVDGEIVGAVELNKENDWIATTDAFEYFNADGSVKTVTVESATEGAEVSFILSDRKEVVTNYENTKVKVTKTWDDAGNQDGMRTNVDITLKADGEDLTSHTFTTEDSNSYTFENLDKYKFDDEGKLVVDNSGKPVEVVYTVEEKNVPTGYAATTSGDAATGFTVTNKHIPEVINVEVKKIWEDNENQDGFRPKNITIKVLDGNTVVDSQSITGSETGRAWSFKSKDLPKYRDGEEIEYTVSEEFTTDPEGKYTMGTPEGSVAEGFTITNTHKPEVIKVKVTKVWEDNENQDGFRPKNITIKVLDGTDVVDSQSITGSGTGRTWSFESKELPKYREGKEIKYTVSEEFTTDPEGKYTMGTPEGSVAEGFTITNTHKPELVDVSVVKDWDDEDDHDGFRPEELKVTLDNTGEVVTLTADDDWEATIKDLPKYKDGKEIKYTWSEEDLPEGYEMTSNSAQGYITTIKNSYEPEYIKVKVTKIWEDNENQDGFRPKNITIKVLDGTTVVDSQNITGSETGRTWSFESKDLPKYREGKEIEYTVSEEFTTDPEGKYTMGTPEGNVAEGFTITNTHKPEVIKTTVKKIWNDDNDHDGFRPDELKVVLSDGTKDVNYTLTENTVTEEAGDWSITVDGLPKYKDGNLIPYAWTEDENSLPEGYTLTDKTVDGYTTTFTNSYDPKYITLSVKKVWNDGDNRDNSRPENLNVVLKANGEKAQSVVLNAGNSWSNKVEGLPQYADGKEIEYTWDEPNLPEGYTFGGTTTEGTITTITNNYEFKTIEVTAKKVWNDNNDQDGFRPNSVKFDLKVGNDVIDTIELDGTKDENGETDAWTATFKNLPKYETGEVGVAIEYSVEEQTTDVLTGEDGPGTYDIITEGDYKTGYTITNKHTPELTEATVTKKWNDANNKDGKRQTTLDVVLKAGDTVVAEKVLSDENNWTVTVKDLPKYADGKEISYTWSEGEIQNGYKQSHTEIDGNNKTITNAETTFVCVKKVWDDDKDRDGLRPGTLRVTLSDGKFVDLNEGNGWFARIDDLYKYNEEDNTEINYTWKEADVDNYELTGNSKEAELTTLTNTHNIATTEATVIKDWQDANNQDGIRPETLKVTLSAENDSTFKDQEVTLAEGNNWTATIKNLPKYTDKGNTEVKYKWTEEKLPKGYEMTGTKISGTTTTITNTHVPELIDIPVKKVWVNNGPYDFPNPTEVRVKLVENGTVVDTTTLSATNNWSDVFTELPKYRPKSVGDEIPYTVIEEPVLDYDTSITGKISDGFTITNTYNPTPTSVEVTKTWDDASDQDGLRPTSIFMTLIGTVNGDVVYKTEAKEVIGGNDVNTWKYTFDKLPLRYVGQEIEWKVTETLEDGSVYTGESVTDLEIKNSYDPQQITLDVSKDWQDSNNNDGKRPAEITVHLLQDGTEIASYVLTEAEGWTHRFGPYPKFRDHGTPISYIIVEDPVADYKNTDTIYTTDSLEYTAQVINTHENETIDIPVVKTWIDENNKYKVRPESITIRLLGDGQEVAVAKLTAATGWKHTFTKLLKYNNGEEISYTITEDEVLNYSTKIDGFNVTNTYNGPTGKTEINPPNTMVEATTSSNDANLFALVYAIILGLTGLIFKKEANS